MGIEFVSYRQTNGPLSD